MKDQHFGQLNEKQAEYIHDILESGRHLLSLINDILDLSKVEAGRMEMEISRVSIRDLLENSLIMIKEKADKTPVTGLGPPLSRRLVEMHLKEQMRGRREKNRFNR